MLAANEAVATFLTEKKVGFLRRGHADPDPSKLKLFAEFAGSLGFPIENPQSRFDIQKAARRDRPKRPERYAVHYGFLRSLKQATYTAEPEGHYALASDDYCHFTSPIRRYPDLQVHRQLGAILDGKKPKADLDELGVARRALHPHRAPGRARRARGHQDQAPDAPRRPDRRGLPRRHHRRRGIRPLRAARRATDRGPGPRPNARRRLLLQGSGDPLARRPPVRPTLPAGRSHGGPRGPGRRGPPRAGPRPHRARPRRAPPPPRPRARSPVVSALARARGSRPRSRSLRARASRSRSGESGLSVATRFVPAAVSATRWNVISVRFEPLGDENSFGLCRPGVRHADRQVVACELVDAQHGGRSRDAPPSGVTSIAFGLGRGVEPHARARRRVCHARFQTTWSPSTTRTIVATTSAGVLLPSRSIEVATQVPW